MSSVDVFRILDASLNRAGEGLRVVEDYVRFVLDDPLLTAEFKLLRHDLGKLAARISPADRHAARETQRDVGTQISTASEASRGTPWDVCAASLKRTEQSLRAIEEYGKLLDTDVAGRAESLRYRLYTLEKAIDVGRSNPDRLKHAKLCVLIDGRRSTDEFAEMVTELAYCGVPMLQLRDNELSDSELVQRAKTMCDICRSPQWICQPGELRYATLCIVNDRPDIAAVVGADGVHVGQEDLSVKDARAIVGTKILIGVSTHNLKQARAAVLDGANYLGAGPTFASHTKAFDSFAGLDYLQEVAAEVRLPTFAIGGINADNLPQVLATGITRAAVSAAVTAAEKPGCAARKLLDMLNDPKHPAAEAASPSLAPSP